MSSFSDDPQVARILEAIAQECRAMAEKIAWLGAHVSGGTADSTTLQTFDFLAQQAQAHAMLVLHVARIKSGAATFDDMADRIGRIPLPDMRARLQAVLHGQKPVPVHQDDTILWMDG